MPWRNRSKIEQALPHVFFGILVFIWAAVFIVFVVFIIIWWMQNRPLPSDSAMTTTSGDIAWIQEGRFGRIHDREKMITCWIFISDSGSAMQCRANWELEYTDCSLSSDVGPPDPTRFADE